jgi:hypothetical protein
MSNTFSYLEICLSALTCSNKRLALISGSVRPIERPAGVGYSFFLGEWLSYLEKGACSEKDFDLKGPRHEDRMRKGFRLLIYQLTEGTAFSAGDCAYVWPRKSTRIIVVGMVDSTKHVKMVHPFARLLPSRKE